jgi:hypothetical protein
VDVLVVTEAIKFLETLDKAQWMATAYFTTIHLRIPIVSRLRFFERLPSLFTGSRADFTALCLCVFLVQQSPSQKELSMHSSLYVTSKGIISLLESTGYQSLEVIQCRILLSFYEMGHGIYPAALISIGACAKAARALGLNRKTFQPEGSEEPARIELEEQKRAWWGVVVLDR